MIVLIVTKQKNIMEGKMKKKIIRGVCFFLALTAFFSLTEMSWRKEKSAEDEKIMNTPLVFIEKTLPGSTSLFSGEEKKILKAENKALFVDRIMNDIPRSYHNISAGRLISVKICNPDNCTIFVFGRDRSLLENKST